MFCINCGKELQKGEISCSYCKFSIFDAQKLLFDELQHASSSSVSQKKSEPKTWICSNPECREKNASEDIFCSKCGTSRYAKAGIVQQSNQEKTDSTAQSGLFEGKDNYYPENTSENDQERYRLIGISVIVIVLLFIVGGIVALLSSL